MGVAARRSFRRGKHGARHLAAAGALGLDSSWPWRIRPCDPAGVPRSAHGRGFAGAFRMDRGFKDAVVALGSYNVERMGRSCGTRRGKLEIGNPKVEGRG